MDDAALRMRRMRGHRHGIHSDCNAATCKPRREVEDKAKECMYARAVLDWCRDKGVPWESLGTELVKLRKNARYPLEATPWMVDEFTADSVVMMEAGYVVEAILREQSYAESGL